MDVIAQLCLFISVGRVHDILWWLQKVNVRDIQDATMPSEKCGQPLVKLLGTTLSILPSLLSVSCAATATAAAGGCCLMMLFFCDSIGLVF